MKWQLVSCKHFANNKNTPSANYDRELSLVGLLRWHCWHTLKHLASKQWSDAHLSIVPPAAWSTRQSDSISAIVQSDSRKTAFDNQELCRRSSRAPSPPELGARGWKGCSLVATGRKIWPRDARGGRMDWQAIMCSHKPRAVLLDSFLQTQDSYSETIHIRKGQQRKGIIYFIVFRCIDI